MSRRYQAQGMNETVLILSCVVLGVLISGSLLGDSLQKNLSQIDQSLALANGGTSPALTPNFLTGGPIELSGVPGGSEGNSVPEFSVEAPAPLAPTPHTGQTLQLKFANGSSASIGNYPTDARSLVENTGSDGATRRYAAVINQLANILEEKGMLPPEKINLFRELANEGHSMANHQTDVYQEVRALSDGTNMNADQFKGIYGALVNMGAEPEVLDNWMTAGADPNMHDISTLSLSNLELTGTDRLRELYGDLSSSGALADPTIRSVVEDAYNKILNIHWNTSVSLRSSITGDLTMNRTTQSDPTFTKLPPASTSADGTIAKPTSEASSPEPTITTTTSTRTAILTNKLLSFDKTQLQQQILQGIDTTRDSANTICNQGTEDKKSIGISCD